MQIMKEKKKKKTERKQSKNLTVNAGFDISTNQVARGW